MKTIIIYESTHHQNTLKLCSAISEKYSVDLVSIENTSDIDLTAYDAIGFASGIAFGKFYKQITDYAKQNLPDCKKVFFIYTAGTLAERYTSEMKQIAESKDCEIFGIYGCKGYDTYGPFKLVGGISKGHPTEDEIKGAVDFYESIVKKYPASKSE